MKQCFLGIFISLLFFPFHLNSQCNSSTVLESTDFESGFGNWVDGGNDCLLNTNATYAASGSNSILLRDNSGVASSTSINLDMSGYDSIAISFSYYARSIEDNEDFFLEISSDGGGSFTTIENWVENGSPDIIENASQSVSLNYSGTLTANMIVRFRADFSANNDYVYIDDVVIEGCSTPLTDLTIEISNAPDTATINAALSISATLTNLTATPVASFNAKYVISTDAVYDPSDSEIDLTSFAALGANSTIAYDASAIIPDSLIEGDYFMIAIADPENLISESDETNNQFSVPIYLLAGATCSDGMQNGSETGIDCGGPDCDPCPSCFDGIQNGDETGIDCGGPDCDVCATCNDGIQNGDETGVDCGGSFCGPCTVWQENVTSIFYSEKNVGIGTSTPLSKLSVIGDVGVQGNVKALDFTASPTIWPDYVFEDDYALPSLQEVEKYIKINKHLPRIPSESEVLSKGTNLSETDILLLEKVEEMTLYIIELNKKIDLLEKQIAKKN